MRELFARIGREGQWPRRRVLAHVAGKIQVNSALGVDLTGIFARWSEAWPFGARATSRSRSVQRGPVPNPRSEAGATRRTASAGCRAGNGPRLHRQEALALQL